MHDLGGEVLPDIVWLEQCVKRAQERAAITVPDRHLTRHACSSARLKEPGKQTRPRRDGPGHE